ncbi:MAG: hypothetical protein HYU76_10635 [Betaproteobacteria bacterium]|nr:hypothetical protein [Betaproteobacteria bacterium]
MAKQVGTALEQSETAEQLHRQGAKDAKKTKIFNHKGHKEHKGKAVHSKNFVSLVSFVVQELPLRPPRLCVDRFRRLSAWIGGWMPFLGSLI